MSEGEIFEAGRSYVATVYFTSDSGYVVDTNTKVTVSGVAISDGDKYIISGALRADAA